MYKICCPVFAHHDDEEEDEDGDEDGDKDEVDNCGKYIVNGNDRQIGFAAMVLWHSQVQDDATLVPISVTVPIVSRHLWNHKM